MSVFDGVLLFGVGGAAVGVEYYGSGDDHFVGPFLMGSAGICADVGSSGFGPGGPSFQAFLDGTHGSGLIANRSGTVGGKIGYMQGGGYGNLLGGVRFNSSSLLESKTPQVGVEAGFTGLATLGLILPGLRLMALTNPPDFSDIVISGGLGWGY